MKQDKYRPLVDAEYQRTWCEEDFDEASQLAWRCHCAQVVLERLTPQESAELESARDKYAAERLAEWNGSKVEEDEEKQATKETRAVYVLISDSLLCPSNIDQ